jgi:hypothetical protein
MRNVPHGERTLGKLLIFFCLKNLGHRCPKSVQQHITEKPVNTKNAPPGETTPGVLIFAYLKKLGTDMSKIYNSGS